MPKGTFFVEVKCLKCGSTVMEVPDDAANNTIIRCENGHDIGPYESIQKAIKFEPASVIAAAIAKPVFKPIKR